MGRSGAAAPDHSISVVLSPAAVCEINRVLVVTRVLSSTVHDARNTLQGISGTAELLAMALPRVDRVEERVRGILRECGALGSRLEELLGLLDGSPTLPSRVDLRRICTNAIELRQASWGRRRVVPVLHVPAGTIVFASAADVLRVVLNLVLNAEQALASIGGGELMLAVEEQDGLVRLLVDDAGPGVAATVQPQLFAARVRPDGGLATGLYVSRHLARQAGGDVTWEAVAGVTRFVATWPASGG